MHSEQVEAIVEHTIEQHLGDLETLRRMLEILRATNTRMTPPGESAAPAQNARLLQSMFLSHTNLARVAGNLAEVAQQLQARIVTLESAVPALQEAVINLQMRVRTLEDERSGESATPPAPQ